MRFEIGKRYPDAIGRRWKVDAGAMIREDIGVLSVWCRQKGNHIAVIEKAPNDNRAYVLLDDGLTTIYADEGVSE